MRKYRKKILKEKQTQSQVTNPALPKNILHRKGTLASFEQMEIDILYVEIL